MSLGDWLAWGGFAAAAVALFAVALGWVGIGTARDQRTAYRSRLVIGWSAIAMGAMLALAFQYPVAWVVALLFVASGTAVIRTARRRSLTDKLDSTPDVDLHAVARQFVFDSRPAARGRIEVPPKLRWSLFIGIAGIGCAVLGVVAAWDISQRDHLGWLGKLLFILGLGGLLTAAVVLPSVYWTQRAVRRIPFLTIDATGLVIGRDPARDAALTWEEIESIDVRVVKGGITDRIIVVEPADDAWLARQPFASRVGAAITAFLYGAPFAISTAPLAVPFEEIIARIAAHRPGLIRPENLAGAENLA